MEFFEVAKRRSSCREFLKGREVDDEKLAKIVDTGRTAPSAGGLYPVWCEVFKSKTEKNKLAKASMGQDFIADASAIIVVWGDQRIAENKYGERGKDLYLIQDGAAAAENMILAATALGFASCWVGAFSEDKVRKALGLKSTERPMVMIPVGYSSR